MLWSFNFCRLLTKCLSSMVDLGLGHCEDIFRSQNHFQDSCIVILSCNILKDSTFFFGFLTSHTIWCWWFIITHICFGLTLDSWKQVAKQIAWHYRCQVNELKTSYQKQLRYKIHIFVYTDLAFTLLECCILG